MQNVALLVGGASIEHDSSLHIYHHLRKLLIEDTQKDIKISQVFYITSNKELYNNNIITISDLPDSEEKLIAGEQLDLSLLPSLIKKSESFLFSLLQGTEGEDGHYQGWADSFNIPSNLGDVYSSSISMHKWTQALIVNSILTDKISKIDTVLLSSSPSEDELEKVVDYFSNRECILKPNSLGISAFCRIENDLTKSTLKDFASQLIPFDNRFLVQERIVGREVSCGCLQIEDKTVVLPVIELHSSMSFLSHEAKFSENGYTFSFLNEEDLLSQRITEISKEIFEFMQFDTACRFDYMVSDKGDIYFLEANSKPGLTAESHYTLMLGQLGLNLIDLIKTSIKNYQHRFKPNTVLRYTVEQVFKESKKAHENEI